MEGFAYPCGVRMKKKIMLTQLLVPVQNSDGTVSVQPTIIERLANPLIGLNFEDFSIHSCLQNGISPKALAIMKDNRFGLDEEIDAFNNMLAEHASELFNVEDN